MRPQMGHSAAQGKATMARELFAVAACALVELGCSCDDADSTRAAAGSSSPASTSGGQPDEGTGTGGSGGALGVTGGRDSETGGASPSGGAGATGGNGRADEAGIGGDVRGRAGTGGTSAGATGGSTDVPGSGGSNTEPGGSGTGAGSDGLAGTPASAGAAGMAGHQQATGGAVSTGGGAGGTVGTGVAGTDAPEGSAGSSSLSCDPLCGAELCGQTEPACLEEAVGLTAGDVIPICVPPGSAGSYTYCGETSCAEAGTPGCALRVHLGSVDWELGPTAAGASSSAVLSATVTQIEGSIGVTGAATCELTVNVPEATPLPVVADGALEPITDGQGTLGLRFASTRVDTSRATVASEPASNECTTVAGLAFTLAGSRINAALRDALNSRAEPLSCLACRADCPQKVACAGQ
jgi:hypothetical protein